MPKFYVSDQTVFERNEMGNEVLSKEWKEICFRLSENVKPNIKEDVFEQKVLMVLERLGWNQYKGEIKTRPSVQIGRQQYIEPDIVMYAPDKRAVVVVEVKRPAEDLAKDQYIGQLKSYMRQMKADFGLLIGREIHVYYDGQLNPISNPVLFLKIPFEKNSDNGVKFIFIFRKENFLNGDYNAYLKDFIENIRKKQKVKELKKIIVSESTKQKIKELLGKEFTHYGLEIVEEVIKDLKVDLRLRNGLPEPSEPIKDPGKKPAIEPTPHRLYTLAELQNMDLGNKKPYKLKIEKSEYSVRSWTELCECFVQWLDDNSYLSADKVPIFNHAERDKYFVNLEPKHKYAERNAQWRQVGVYYVDTKYAANIHIKNVITALKQLGIRNIDLKIGIGS